MSEPWSTVMMNRPSPSRLRAPGRALVVTERGGDKISSYAVGMDGMLGELRMNPFLNRDNCQLVDVDAGHRVVANEPAPLIQLPRDKADDGRASQQGADPAAHDE